VQVSGKAIVAALQKAGWTRQKSGGGSHVKLTRPGRRPVVVPVHGNRPLPPGTLNNILRQAGLTADDLKDLL
jgi:predicted RNA binding protein YcfA (HicA-like mRNA interferase family)